MARKALCDALGMSEELLPIETLTCFMRQHARWVVLAQEFPQALRLEETTAKKVIEVFRSSLENEDIGTVYDALRTAYERARTVAEHGYVVWPKQSTENCIVAAYAALMCDRIYDTLCWSGSILTTVQRSSIPKYPVVDFHFWAMYGSWSWCKACGSFWFNDKYLEYHVSRPEHSSNSRCHGQYPPRCP